MTVEGFETPPPAPQIGEIVTLRGTVRAAGERPVVTFSVLKVRGLSERTALARASFSLDLLTDGVVKVGTLEGDPKKALVPRTTVRGQWSEVCAHPLVLPHGTGFLPGPHVRVEATGTLVGAGDRVTIVARVSALGPGAERGSFRETTHEVVKEVVPLVIAVGDDADDLAASAWRRIRPKALRPEREYDARGRGVFSYVLFAIACALFVGAQLAVDRALSYAAMLAVGCGLLGAAYALRPAVTHVPTFRGNRENSVFATVATAVVLIITQSIVFGVASGGRLIGTLGVLAGTLLPAAVAFGSAFFVLRGALRFARLADLLASGRDTGVAERAWRVIEGVADSSRARAYASGRRVILSRTTEAVPVESNDTFEVATDAGSFEVATKDALWASSIVEANGKGQQRRVETILANGSRVLVAGWTSGKDRLLRAAGPESLIIFACEPTDDPRTEIRRALRVRHQTAGAIALLGVVPGIFLVMFVAGLHPTPPAALLRGNAYSLQYGIDEPIESCGSYASSVTGMTNRDDDSTTVDIHRLAAMSGGPLFYMQSFGSPSLGAVQISTNGWMSLTPQLTNGLSGSIGSRSRPNHVIAAHWRDLLTGPGGVCYVMVGNAPTRRFIVQWNDAGYYNGMRRANLAFQIVVHEAAMGRDSMIDLRFLSMGNATQAVAGIENAEGTEGVTPDLSFGVRDVRFTPR